MAALLGAVSGGLRLGATAAAATAVSSWRPGFVKRVAAARCGAGVAAVPARGVAETSSGAVLPKPEKVSLGLTKVFTVVIPFLIVGAIASKKGAELLEEHDIFVPDDDDDDD